MIKRIIAVVMVMTFVAFPVFATGKYDWNSPEFREAASTYMCMCGCGQDHLECNMDGCGLNDSFKTEILEMLNDGWTQDEIKDYYVNMYGEVILTAPEKRGFSLTAWITPFAVLGMAGVGVVFLIRKWVSKAELVLGEDHGSDPEIDETEDEVMKSMIEEERKKHY